MNARTPALILVLLVSLLTAPVSWADGGVEAGVEVRREPLRISGEMDLLVGFHRLPYDRLALPIGSYLMLDAMAPRRNAGASAQLGLGVDPLGPEGEVGLLDLEIYASGLGDVVDVRGGRMNLVRGGRFRFVDGADLRFRLAEDFHLAVWGGMAWHPERTGLFQGGSTWGVDLSYRSSRPVGGAVRYDHSMSLEGRWIERVGGDVNLSLPRASGLVIEARLDAIPNWALLELVTLAGEVRAHHRVHLRFEGGMANPEADQLGKGGTIYPLFAAGPTVYLDGRARLALPAGVLTVDAGALGITSNEDTLSPGVRGAVGHSGHPGRRWRHVARVSALHGPGGSAVAGVLEVGRRLGPLNVDLIAEQAFYQLEGRPWRGVTHLGTQLGVAPARPLRLSLTGQLELGRGPVPEGQLLLFVTLRLHRGRERLPAQERDRYLSPWSPYRWDRDEMPRSPGTVPGADPYQSVPMGVEESDEG